MLSYLGFDARQSSEAVPLELKPFSLQFKPREIINIWLTSLFSVWTVSYGLVFSVRKKLGPLLAALLLNSVSKGYDSAKV